MLSFGGKKRKKVIVYLKLNIYRVFKIYSVFKTKCTVLHTVIINLTTVATNKLICHSILHFGHIHYVWIVGDRLYSQHIV